MADINLKGMGVALITPFKQDESVDYEALGRLVDYLLQNGTDYLVVLGTTAETPTLTEEEKKNIILEVRQICRNLPTLIRQIEIKKKSIENAEHTYEINLEKYRNGNLTGMDLQQYQTQLTNAKQEYTNAIISYKLELLNLKIQTLWDFENNKSYLPVELLK